MFSVTYSEWVSGIRCNSCSDSGSNSDSSRRGYPVEPYRRVSLGDRGLDLDLDVVMQSTDDLDSWSLEDSYNLDALSSYMEELGSGFGVELGRDEVRADGLRVASIDSESDSCSDGEIVDLDSFIDDRMGLVNSNEEFEWEELDQATNESENLIVAIDSVEGLSLSSSSISAPVEDEERSVEWGLLMAINNQVNLIEDPFMFDADYDTPLEQLVDNDIDWMGTPPAAERVVENLPLVDLGKEELVVCAICTDEVVDGEMVNKLPCCHYYHGECIVPWLRIRNTCPLCRYELPTDDQDYESRRRLRGASGISTDLTDGYNFEMFS
ncbi:hypothetical protein P3X46_016290 [Hevea brasiliensis]|uniref:RING-type E3 ubiquitin transferase n=1 Tax=Hevea brasiliensis TaxID=3981 RepID=A0ABQ9M2N8_HEVBR|nr:E3 ubiquitin-protein ligase CIP8 [Hevea brasiliensis]KAJ9173124.1 hypothetical protein P3X46_016290 [Hevea brasiliensis]